jgi:hypothetical protein
MLGENQASMMQMFTSSLPEIIQATVRAEMTAIRDAERAQEQTRAQGQTRAQEQARLQELLTDQEQNTSQPPPRASLPRASFPRQNVGFPAGQNSVRTGSSRHTSSQNTWSSRRSTFSIHPSPPVQPAPSINNPEAKIKHWPLSFTGRQGDIEVEDFIFQAETLCHRTLNSDFQLLSDNIHMLFKGKGLEWYWRYQKYNRRFSWHQLTHALRQSFSIPRNDDEVLREARDRLQQPGESFDSFYEDMQKILDKLSTPLPEPQMLSLIKENLTFELQRSLLYQSIISLEHLRGLCLSHEKLMRRRPTRALRTTPGYRGAIAEVDAEQDEIQMEEDSVGIQVAEVQSPRASTSARCWNCQSDGHTFRQCNVRSKKVFCWGCGKPDTYRDSCEKCQQGNRRWSEMKLPPHSSRSQRESSTQTNQNLQ